MRIISFYVQFGTSLLHIRKTIPMCDLERPFCTSFSYMAERPLCGFKRCYHVRYALNAEQTNKMMCA